MTRMVLSADASLAARRAASRFGMAMAAMMPMGTNMTSPPMFRTRPAMATPLPPYLAGSRFCRFSATTPSTVPTIEPIRNMPNVKKPTMPITSDAIAWPALFF